MNAKKYVAMFATTLTLSICLPVSAQRDAGAKMRGEFGTGYIRSTSQSRSQTVVETPYIQYVSPTRLLASPQENADSQSRRSFSFEPAPFRVGDQVVVASESAKVMRGTNTVATLPKDQHFTVTEIVGRWVGTEMTLDGTKINGWISQENLAQVGTASGTPNVQRRSFSFEPSEPVQQTPMMMSREFRRSESQRPSYTYPKTDPRRYQH